MFCYQCEQTTRGTGCTDFAVCGKDESSAVLQDLLIQMAKGVSQYAHRARKLGAKDPVVDVFIIEALFTTVTNVNFDPLRIQAILNRGVKVRQAARELYEAAASRSGVAAEVVSGPATWTPALSIPELVGQGAAVSLPFRRERLG
ncbi:MAG: hydroxylamine reductase, partial [Verrucomicrobiota bacterium]